MPNPGVRTSVSAGAGYGTGYGSGGGRSGCNCGATTPTATITAISRHSTGDSGSGSACDSGVNVRYGLCVLMFCEFEHCIGKDGEMEMVIVTRRLCYGVGGRSVGGRGVSPLPTGYDWHDEISSMILHTCRSPLSFTKPGEQK